MSTEHPALESSWALIRALDGSSDPPQGGELLKVELALAAWRNPNLLVPCKAEVLGRWALKTMIKCKDQVPERNVNLDQRYWSLLNAIFSSITAYSGEKSHIPPLEMCLMNRNHLGVPTQYG
ncbi:uncharacterized protein EI90DRAFT_801177 [Cantharellus anzutake]|uniref:uncharacterized protein n=1 Tax=Cantharellus anzutake TaxID=1750568 RepID=UPI00190346EA|nr:uncharacterized protein EI90DRAFT_801177 [Cantharellus anzutake]KAF8342890.1 hypothetical protein EI90DRAFT_801177 [Cantharellus anzutake]